MTRRTKRMPSRSPMLDCVKKLRTLQMKAQQLAPQGGAPRECKLFDALPLGYQEPMPSAPLLVNRLLVQRLSEAITKENRAKALHDLMAYQHEQTLQRLEQEASLRKATREAEIRAEKIETETMQIIAELEKQEKKEQLITQRRQRAEEIRATQERKRLEKDMNIQPLGDKAHINSKAKGAGSAKPRGVWRKDKIKSEIIALDGTSVASCCDKEQEVYKKCARALGRRVNKCKQKSNNNNMNTPTSPPRYKTYYAECPGDSCDGCPGMCETDCPVCC